MLLLHLELNSALLQAPGRLVGPLIDALEPKLPEPAYAALSAYQRAATAVWSGAENADAAQRELDDGLEAVRHIGLTKGAAAE